jgi:tRNA_anti-like
MTRIVSRVVICAAVLALAGCPNTKSNAPPPNSTPISVKAGELLTEYGTNAVGADAKYKGKLLRVTGKFGSAQKNPLGGYVVQLLPEEAGDGSLSAVQCFIVESAQADVGTMQPGQTVTFDGTCDGQAVGQIKLSRCTVVK